MPRRAADPSGPAVEVLRLGHRAGRDPRLTTHLALTARAFGAERMHLHPPDREIARRLEAVRQRWGGHFAVRDVPSWQELLRTAPGTVVHLTMYGEPLERVLPRLRRRRHILVVVGGAKVPAELYRLADVNVAVGHQPHSEVAALAVFLTRLRGVPGPAPPADAQVELVPSARGKQVRQRGETGR